MPVRVQVVDHEIGAVGLYEPLPRLMRLDVLPFLLLYSTAAYLYSQRPQEDVIVAVFTALAVCFHALVFLAGEWNVSVFAWLTCAKLACINGNDTQKIYAMVTPSRSTLPCELCRCFIAAKSRQEKSGTLESGERIPVVWFSYQNIMFYMHEGIPSINHAMPENIPCFRRLEFPTQYSIKHYLASEGYSSSSDQALAALKWGKNDFDIPVPLFVMLLKEQLVAPFFVFQFFCMLLWCLDEHVYYSMLTLVMLVIFECTVVLQRQRNMETLNQMRRAPRMCFVYRMKEWIQIWSNELVPGDICSVGQSTNPSHGGAGDDAIAPCDVLLLQGSCIVNEAMLSGESIPVRKYSLEYGFDEETAVNVLQIDDGTTMEHKKFVVFGGTKILQHSLDASISEGESIDMKIPDAPNQGCIGFVLRTGFGTTQGNLMRTILYSSQRVTANNTESMWFILVLLVFAVCAAGYVLLQGLQDSSRDRFKLLLHCIMIITSVVPPELPMELSLAVTNSLIALTKHNIFCTEPFRIPLAGRIDVCCFDKTGTLTSDELTVRGVVGLDVTSNKNISHHGELDIISPENLPIDTELILAGCQSLVQLHGSTLGDPLELASLRSIRWNVVSGGRNGVSTNMARPSYMSSLYAEIESVDILHRFSFSSDMKRMSTVVSIFRSDNEEPVESRLLTKGAPEVLETLFRDKPSHYTRVYRHYASKGCRVLALGYRHIPSGWSANDIRNHTRQSLENDLEFAGFLVLDCPLKNDTKHTIRDLMASNHEIVLITGDNALTACDVARQVGVNSKQPLVLNVTKNKGGVEWLKVDDGFNEQDSIPFSLDTVEKLRKQYDLCVTGDALATFLKQIQSDVKEEAVAHERFLDFLANICLYISVFSRTSPQQKENIIMAMNQCGKTTAMCGDGTNDVGALKQAHVGISIVNTPKQGSSSADYQVVRLGDASIASPFTSKRSSIRAIKHLVRQGRCTLVTTIQMYKILGVNCLVTAYYLSALFSYGVKNGDQQLTVVGLGIAMFFLFLSRAEPTKKLSQERPPQGVFCISVLVSMLGQFIIHMLFLAMSLQLAQPYVDYADPSMHPDGKFNPNVINSIMFLVSSTMQVTTFVANYRGQPFMENLSENKLLYRSALVSYAVLGMASWEIFPWINDVLELVPLPNEEMQWIVFSLMVGDTVTTLLFECALVWISSKLS